MKRFLIAIIILIGSFFLVGLIEKLNQTVAYNSLFYIQEIDTYVDVQKDTDSSFVYLYFQLKKEPKKDLCEDVIRVPEKTDGIDVTILNTNPYKVLIDGANYGIEVISHSIFDFQPISKDTYFSHQIIDDKLGICYKDWSTEEIEEFRDSISVSLSLWGNYENCAVSSNGSLYGRYIQPMRRIKIKSYQNL